MEEQKLKYMEMTAIFKIFLIAGKIIIFIFLFIEKLIKYGTHFFFRKRFYKKAIKFIINYQNGCSLIYSTTSKFN